MIECPDSCSSHLLATSIYFCFLLARLHVLSFSLRADTEGIVLARVKANDADCTISNLLLLPIVGSKLLAFSLRADTDEGRIAYCSRSRHRQDEANLCCFVTSLRTYDRTRVVLKVGKMALAGEGRVPTSSKGSADD